ncbi:hypothetical protein DICPUDRAFT_37115 [Dictyostelium purpureum]|uniref:THAP4-like heme-binding domain-containing protein n=1 Tax=Dictyostelium purpureum TaxID=5786 RepID=F0ZS90_DICPU|nr:uncharacterized protein DICPUDRAFT_37115 [Dictyostelium purpureum]EGC33205.1 hypothetical protein DICPUDRAFT_37115 [Dictyostelium purpureum]|eukprot:XP_003290287.1 hypothetical protein DICPUDRAFT_37115 [Dictyostelium purpureum]
MNIHSNISKFAFILGKWSGKGEGIYPTIQSFKYTEEMEFTTNGKPFIAYQQKTWNDQGSPLHCESGYLRFPPNGSIEWVISEPTGVTEIYEGRVENSDNGDTIKICFKLTNIQRTPTAKAPHTTNVHRNLVYNSKNNTLSYYLDMATEKTVELTRHLEAHFEKKN